MMLSRTGFGALQLAGPGAWGPPVDRAEALAVLRTAVDRGVRYLDTADFYGPHVANELIREALHPYPRDLVVGVKVGVVRDEWRAWNASTAPDSLREQVEENLSTLGAARLDLVYLRVGGDGLMFPDEVPFADAFGALAELREKGLIRHLGLSGVSTAQLAQARRIAPVAAVQNRFHLLDRSSADVLAVCEADDIAFVPYFPLGAGVLRDGVDRATLPPGFAPSEEQESIMGRIAAAHGATRSQLALAWLHAHSPVIVTIPGTRSLAHLEENLAAATLRLTPEEIKSLDRL